MAPTTQIYPGIPSTSNGGMIPSEHPQPFPKQLPTDLPRPESPKISSDSIKVKKWGPVRWQVPKKGMKWKKGWARVPKEDSDDSGSHSEMDSSADPSSNDESSASDTGSGLSSLDLSDSSVDATHKMKTSQKETDIKSPTRPRGLDPLDIPGSVVFIEGDIVTPGGTLIPDGSQLSPELATRLVAQNPNLADWPKPGPLKAAASPSKGTGFFRHPQDLQSPHTSISSSSTSSSPSSPLANEHDRPHYRPKSKIKLQGSDESCVTQTDEGLYDKKGRQVGLKRTWVTHVRKVVIEEEKWEKKRKNSS